MSKARIGIDVGGTFTDVFLFDETAETLVAFKLPTNVSDPSVGILAAAAATLEQTGTGVEAVT